eukprot:TRINITY_DN21329_c0_g1_i2.p5 TRINITY_DN21329_c0_g1~~TRINITY_DN21329_c0_g1_i2.p5  ORF type:complete len:107 (+),score=11.98 TRINITY_DN21329_c0_g1_i2:489-809(+)
MGFKKREFFPFLKFYRLEAIRYYSFILFNKLSCIESIQILQYTVSSGQTLGVKAQRFRGHTSPHRNIQEKLMQFFRKFWIPFMGINLQIKCCQLFLNFVWWSFQIL